MKIWIIADTHFYHENIKKFQGRPEDFNEQIIKNWNKVIACDDLVIHLGDVLFGMNKEQTLPSLMATLPGKKILCRGNHDLNPALWYMERGFDFVCDYFVSSDIAFSHVPLTPLPFQTMENNQKLVKWNIHGHFHRPKQQSDVINQIHVDKYHDGNYYQEHKEQYILVHIEDTFAPIALEAIIKENRLNSVFQKEGK